MLKRIITGAVLIACLVGFFAIRTLDFRLFHPLIFLFSVIGSFEFVKMAKGNLTLFKKTIIVTLSILLVPVFCLFERNTSSV